jgi:hypothetical protein
MQGMQRPFEIPEERLQIALRESARISSVVALYCDRTEHNEDADAESLRDAAKRLRYLAGSMAYALDVHLVEAYAARVEQVEGASWVEPLLPSPAVEIRRARTWRDLQLAQTRHDRHYHPDVFGLSKRDQLIHFSLHLSKLTGAIALLFDADQAVWIGFVRNRLPDLLLFGIKLSTITGEHLAAESIPTGELGALTS